jgi:cold shock CspA family protein
LPIGRIKSLHTETSIGVISQADGGHDIVFQPTSLISGTFDRLSEGQVVEFDCQPYRNSSGRSRAVNIRLVVVDA